MRIARRDFVEPTSPVKKLSSENFDLLVAAIIAQLKEILGTKDSAEFSPNNLQASFLVDQKWAAEKYANGKDFLRAYNVAVAELTKDIVDVPAEVDKETGEIIKPAVTHKDYKIGENFSEEPIKEE